MPDEKTKNLNLPLPHSENPLDIDVHRLRESFKLLDEVIVRLTGDLGRDLTALRGVLNTDLVELQKSLGLVAAAAETPAGAQAKADAARDQAVDAAGINALQAIAEALAALRITPVGDIRLWPFRAAELPSDWHFCNGDRYSLTSPQGAALNSLSANYKNDWRITVSGGYISLPNLFHIDGRGLFLRAVDGTTRLVGSIQDDTGRNATGTFGAIWGASGGAAVTGVFSSAVTLAGVLTQGSARSEVTYTLNLSKQWGVHAGAEFTPVNVGMTPAIYLGI